jgi:hypothetical protein
MNKEEQSMDLKPGDLVTATVTGEIRNVYDHMISVAAPNSEGFTHVVILSDAEIEVVRPANFPGTTGSVWVDSEGDAWVVLDDHRMRYALGWAIQPSSPESVYRTYGPMTLVYDR